MTVEEFYVTIGSDYNEVLARGVKPERMERYLTLFKKEEVFDNLCESVEKKDYKAGFEYSHNLKGLCLNLGLEKLQKASSVICEELRNGNPGPQLDQMLEEVKVSYHEVIDAIDRLLQEK